MVRNFSLTFAAVMLRLYIPISVVAGIEFAIAYPIIAWLCWVPNVVFAEWRYNAVPQPAPHNWEITRSEGLVHKLRWLRLMVTMCLGCLPAAIGAQQLPDMDLMAKWSAVAVVHYAVVGEYAGDTMIIYGAQGTSGKARVTDRVELGFDWNQNETALVGRPTFTNFPSRVTLIPVAGLSSDPDQWILRPY